MINTSMNINTINPRTFGNRLIQQTPQNQTNENISSNMTLSNICYVPKINFRGTVDNNSQEKVNEFLKTCVYDFKTTDGNDFKGTIKDFIEAHIVKRKEQEFCTNLLHGTMSESRENIIKNGFDSKKVSRTLCGPGTCFTGSEYEAHRLGGGALIKCDFAGNIAYFKHGFYKKIFENSELLENVAQQADIKLDFSSYDLIQKHVGEFVRQTLINELNIDAGVDPGNPPSVPGCFVIYNTANISNIQKYN